MPKEFLKEPNLEQHVITVKTAGPEDWRDYKEIWLEAVEKNPEAFSIDADPEDVRRETYRRDKHWKAHLKDPNAITLLLKDNKDTKGLAMAIDKSEIQRGLWRIRHVYISPAIRGQHAGEKLMVEILEKIKERGGKQASLNVMDNPEQIPALKLYEKLGFENKGKYEEVIHGKKKGRYDMLKNL